MDLLCQRYAIPFFLLDNMIQQGRLFEFVIELNQIEVEQDDNQKLWDIWLHRVFDKTFDEWRDSLPKTETKPATESEIKATVKDSYELLNGFNPNKRG